MAWSPFVRIARPTDCHNVPTADAYRAFQANIIAHNKAAYPSRNWRDPFPYAGAVTPIINAGRWGVICPDCGNFAIYDPDWQLACCCECGARFEAVTPPAGWTDAELVLMARSKLSNRNWNVEAAILGKPPETVDALRAQNAAAGDPLEVSA